MINDIMSDLSRTLDIYEQKVGCGFFTRLSRFAVVKKLREDILKYHIAIKTQPVTNEQALQARMQVRKMVEHLLDFAITMQGKKPDVGFGGQSRLHNFLWGNHPELSRGGVYQQVYEFLQKDDLGKEIYQTLQDDPKYKQVSKQRPVTIDDLNHEGRSYLNSVQTLAIYQNDKDKPYQSPSDFNELGKKVSESIMTDLKFRKSKVPEHLENLIGYDWAGNHSLRRI